MAAKIDEQNSNINSPAAPEKAVFSAPTLNLGTPDTTWAKHGLLQYPIEFKGQSSRAKAIIRNNQDLIAIAGNGYTLLPNEEAIEMANQAAKLAGFVPFFEKMKDSNWEKGRLTGHILCNNKETQMHSFYVPKEFEHDLDKKSSRSGHEIWGVPGDKVYTGVDVVNSIDGKKSFGVSIFSFRTACKNGVLWGKQAEVGSLRFAHTKKLESVIGQLKTLFVQQMDQARLLLEGYKRLDQRTLVKEDVDALTHIRLPEKILPEYIKDEEQVKQEAFKDITAWKAYNDITAQIWHNPTNDITAKEFQFNQLHKAIPVLTVPTRR
ncbi:MAG: DUF932 domain-containing protein [Methanocellales archaeon]|nr:DUF932 domain-containing protein [Methanocellales archaeon]